jgi:hypothetical protein
MGLSTPTTPAAGRGEARDHLAQQALALDPDLSESPVRIVRELLDLQREAGSRRHRTQEARVERAEAKALAGRGRGERGLRALPLRSAPGA